jgi:hypothetical protein
MIFLRRDCGREGFANFGLIGRVLAVGAVTGCVMLVCKELLSNWSLAANSPLILIVGVLAIALPFYLLASSALKVNVAKQLALRLLGRESVQL